MELTGSQKKAINSAVAGLAPQGARGQLYRACGTGKTVVMHRIADRFWMGEPDGIVVFCAPTIGLVGQTIRQWQTYGLTAATAEVHAICSRDPKDRRAEGGEAGAAASFDVPSTTDVEVLAGWIVANAGRPRLLVSTHISLPRVVEALTAAGASATITFADEAHRFVGGVSPAVEALTTAECLGRVLFATATPRVIVGRKLKAGGEASDAPVFCMSDDSLFGPVVAPEYSMREAIRAGDLVDYRVVVIRITDADLAGLATSEGEVQDLVSHLAIARAAQLHGIRRIIGYHNRIADSRRWVDDHASVTALAGFTPGVAFHLDGSTSGDVRDTVLEGLGAHTGETPMVVSNCNVLTEGIDVPDLDAVALMATRRSGSNLTQILGRAIRTSRTRNKRLGYFIVPVYLPGAATAETLDDVMADDERWQTVFDLLRQLAASDPMLREQLHRQQRAARGITIPDDETDGPGPDGIMCGGGQGDTTGNKPDGGDILIIDSITNLPTDLANALHTRILDHTFPGHARHADNLADYAGWVEAQGRHPKERAADSVERRLAPLAQRWRKAFRGGSLPVERQREIEAITGWVWEPLETKFADNLAEYACWVVAQGRHPKWNAADPVERRLATLGNTWRDTFRGGSLHVERQREIEAITGWVWEPLEAKFADNLAEYACWVVAQGRHPRSSNAADPVERRLATLAQRWRKAFKGGSLPLHRQREIEAITGWVWEPLETAFAGNLAEYACWVVAQGRHPKWNAADPVERRLAELGNTWRSAFRSGLMPVERQREIEAIPGWVWKPRRAKIADTLAEYARWVAAQGRHPKRHVADPVEHRLAGVASSWRKAFSGGSLPAERQREIEAIPGWVWEPLEAKFADNLAECASWVVAQGRHPKEKAADPVERGLAILARNWRKAFKCGSLPVERQREIEAIPGWVWEGRFGPVVAPTDPLPRRDGR